MKKIFALCLVALMIFSLAACGGDDAKANKYGLINEGKLMVAMEAEYPPMEYKDENGKLVGFDVEMMAAIGEKLGVEIEYVEMAWDGIFMGLSASHYDAVCSGVSVTQERIDAQQMQFSEAYMNNGQYIIVREGVTNVNQPEDLAGLKVGVQFQTTADIAAQKYKNEDGIDFELTAYDSVQQAFLGLEAGQLDVVVADASVAVAYVNANDDKFDISNAKLTNEPMAIAVAYGNDELTEALNGALAELVADGTLAKLSEKYVGTDLTQNIDMNLVSVE
ncbi:MAG: amino acid ABC transporter substrate-binding protein [Anaerofustis stercorihominis]|nr:amino acid ABC transporter substrate-binding protein [Anaerofustis stercorihominis]